MDKELCAACNDGDGILYTGGNGSSYCGTCFDKIYPPFITIMLFPNSNPALYNIEVGKYEKFNDINIFTICGWEIRMVSLLSTGVEMYHLEYFGEYNCPRCLDNRGQMENNSGNKYCVAATCRDFIDKKQSHERTYPNQKSFYLTWKYRNKPWSRSTC
jgi:hypothetical protein